jgi:hypothetical protein
LRDKDAIQIVCFKVVEEVKKLGEIGAATFAAVETELPNARISGCYFHFGQNLWRRVQSLGLARDYRQNKRLKKTIRKVIAIGYLPMALVRALFSINFVQNESSNRLFWHLEVLFRQQQLETVHNLILLGVDAINICLFFRHFALLLVMNIYQNSIELEHQ